MKKISKIRRAIGLSGLVSFLALVIFGFLIDGKFSFFAVLQNAAETLLMNPVFDLNELSCKNAANIIFMIFSAFVPVCGLVLIATFIKPLIKWFYEKLNNKLLIIGDNPEIDSVLADKGKYKRIIWLTDQVVDDEKDNDYLLKGIAIKNTDWFKSEGSKAYSSGETFSDSKKINKYLKKFDDVILIDKSDIHNIQNYITLSSLPCCKERTIHFHVLINSLELKYNLMDYFDSHLSDADSAHTDLHIFNLQQITAETALEKLPLHTITNNGNENKEISGNEEKGEENAVHLLIVGLGQSGESLLCHAMNQGVITADNNLLIDVVDMNINEVKERLTRRFGEKNNCLGYNSTENSFYVKEGHSDGRLTIHLTECDVCKEFADVAKCLSKYDPFTYIALCIPDANVNLHIVNELRKASIKNIPLAVRMSDSKDMKKFVANASGTDIKNVLLIGEHHDIVRIPEIINNEKERLIRDYHYRYIKNLEKADSRDKVGSADSEWSKLKYFQRQANRSLYYHKPVKKLMFSEAEEAEFRCFEAATKEFFDADNLSKELTNKNNKEYVYPKLVAFAKTEHRRWNYSYISEGWKYSISKNEKEKEHNCILDWESLCKSLPGVTIYDLLTLPTLIEEANNNEVE